jgi:hypothetical protein
MDGHPNTLPRNENAVIFFHGHIKGAVYCLSE